MKTNIFSTCCMPVMVAMLLTGAAVFRVWVHQDSVQLGYALSAEEQRREQLRTTLHELEVEMAAARSPAHLVKLAARLGLHPPTPQQLINEPPKSHLASANTSSDTEAGLMYARP